MLTSAEPSATAVRLPNPPVKRSHGPCSEYDKVTREEEAASLHLMIALDHIRGPGERLAVMPVIRSYKKGTAPLTVLFLFLMLFAGCVSGPQIRTKAGVVDEDLKLARQKGAFECAPRELATGEAHLTFALGELRKGNWKRAHEHIGIAMVAASEAVELSHGCLEPEEEPEPPPVIIPIEEDPEFFLNDTDGDGLPDEVDLCPRIPGPVWNLGCPIDGVLDSDGDGIPDDEDDCPYIPGPEENYGCPWPDRDGDGVPDHLDECPDVPGPAWNDGCPIEDRDGDGIPDDEDACPDEFGIPELDGCPPTDSSGDGIPDHLDACPDVKGSPEFDGCLPPEPEPEEEPREYQLVELHRDRIEIRQRVHFETAKWRILEDSFDLLNEVAQVLEDHPRIKIRIEGHTDNVGGAAMNLQLSQNRAESVRDYLIERGVSPDRMEAVGFGLTRPIASNETAVGREQNRRVEFVIIEQ